MILFEALILHWGRSVNLLKESTGWVWYDFHCQWGSNMRVPRHLQYYFLLISLLQLRGALLGQRACTQELAFVGALGGHSGARRRVVLMRCLYMFDYPVVAVVLHFFVGDVLKLRCFIR